jgi:hypothetical protein
MIKRIDQQIRVNKLMIDFYCKIGKITSKRLDNYMKNYLSMMMTISSVMLLVSGSEENLQKKIELWLYLKNKDERLYLRMRYRLLGTISNLPGTAGRKLTKHAYRLTSKKYKFN